MTRISQLNRGKVETHGRALGVSSPEDLEKRAKEIALIAGRTEATPSDREQARAELLATDLPPTVSEDGDGNMQSLSRDPSDPAADRGRQAPEYIDVDEEQAVERLALEGVEEAQHEQMVQARNDVDEPLRSRPRGQKK